MKRAAFALCVACLGVWTSAEVQSPLSVLPVTVGNEVTLNCIIRDNLATMFYWYKEKIGEEPKMVSNFYKYRLNGKLTGEFENNPRFTLDYSAKHNHLRISKVETSDTATYYCVSGFSLNFTFVEGITVIVQDSCLNVSRPVYQSAPERIQTGQSVTLRCTVHTGAREENLRVYWLKKSSKETLPGVIYTHDDGSEECEKNTRTPICVYSLSLKSLDRSNAGTYYCVVSSCGHIVFGNGTKVEIQGDGPLALILSGALAFTIVLVVVLAFAVYRVYKTNSRSCSDWQATHAAAVASNMEGRQDADDLHYAALKDTKRSRLRRRQDDNVSQCVYSSVKLSS